MADAPSVTVDQPQRTLHVFASREDGAVVMDLWENEDGFRRMMDDPEFRRNVKAADWPSDPKVDIYEVNATDGPDDESTAHSQAGRRSSRSWESPRVARARSPLLRDCPSGHQRRPSSEATKGLVHLLEAALRALEERSGEPGEQTRERLVLLEPGPAVR